MSSNNSKPGPWAHEPHDLPPPPGEPMRTAHLRFRLEPFAVIHPNLDEEWLVKKLFPARGVAAIFGKPGSLKSFIALDLALHVALGWSWAGRAVRQGPAIYVASEGAPGLRKRIGGAKVAKSPLPADVPFYLVETPPNLGTGEADREALIEAITSQGVRPGVLVLDTLAQSLGGADENGAGMTQFVANATGLAAHFKCLVIAIHHAALADGNRMRGHSSLLGAVDAAMLCEKADDALEARLTLQKSKDDASGEQLVARLSTIDLGLDSDHDPVTTLVVNIIEGAAPMTPKAPRRVPRNERLLMMVLDEAISDEGEDIRPFQDGGTVHAVSEDVLRSRYYARLAEEAGPDEDAARLAERQRKAFSRSITPSLKAQAIIAGIHSGRRFLWPG